MPVQIMDCYGFVKATAQGFTNDDEIKQLVICFLIQIMLMAVVMKCL